MSVWVHMSISDGEDMTVADALLAINGAKSDDDQYLHAIVTAGNVMRRALGNMPPATLALVLHVTIAQLEHAVTRTFTEDELTVYVAVRTRLVDAMAKAGAVCALDDARSAPNAPGGGQLLS